MLHTTEFCNDNLTDIHVSKSKSDESLTTNIILRDLANLHIASMDIDPNLISFIRENTIKLSPSAY